MQKLTALILAVCALSFVSIQASAAKITEQRVKNVCGSSMTTGGTSNATVSGCEMKCGGKTCTYNCCSGSGCGEKGCHGHVVGLTAGGKKGKFNLPAATLIEIKKMSLARAGKMPAAASKSKLLKGGVITTPKTKKKQMPHTPFEHIDKQSN